LGQPEDGSVHADYELVKPLNGKTPPLTGIYQPKELATVGRSSRALQVGDESILFLSQMVGHPTPNSHCGVMTPAPDVLKATQEGIADERSVPESQ
jgi:hypothetical protein